MAIEYISIFQSKALKIFSQIRIFGLKTNHLATLRREQAFVPAETTCAHAGSFMRYLKLMP
jgi:hypothetical protein